MGSALLTVLTSLALTRQRYSTWLSVDVADDEELALYCTKLYALGYIRAGTCAVIDCEPNLDLFRCRHQVLSWSGVDVDIPCADGQCVRGIHEKYVRPIGFAALKRYW